jgi:drug/metabolite transporter (DMT)-like permease
VSPAPAQRSTARLLLAFFIIYFVWGSTYLAIRIAVTSVPPLFTAGVRFTLAGVLLLLWSRIRREPGPSFHQWRNLAITAALMFLCGYSGLFWAETKIASGVAAVLVGTIPVWMALIEIAVFQRRRLPLSVGLAIALGFSGVALLALHPGSAQIAVLPCLAILGAEIAWSLGTVLSKTQPLPESKTLTAGAQMALGGIMLLLASWLTGETTPWPHISRQAGFAILYLIVAGSLIAFTAYLWLLARMSATVVSSYAYVNPVVALAIGHWLGKEALTTQIYIGTALVLASVVLILRTPQPAH